MQAIRGAAAVGMVLGLAFVAPVEESRAQVRIESEAAEIEITGRVHGQFNTTSVGETVATELLVRRARLTGEVTINDFIAGKVQPEFGEGDVELKDAYVRLTFDPALRATVGQFKRRFDRFQLLSSTRHLVIERDGEVRGLDTCLGTGGVCSFSRLTDRLEYSDRDIGLMLDGRHPNGTVTYMVAVTNGAGPNAPEENDGKSFSGRLELTPIRDLTVAGNVSVHDFVNAVVDDENDYAAAYGADVEWGNFEQGLHVIAGAVAGDNWRNLDGEGDPSTFIAVQGIVSYRKPVRENRFLSAVEPLGRVSWGNPDTDLEDDGAGVLLTPGFIFHFSGRNRFALNLDIWAPNEGDGEFSFKAQSYLHF